MFAGKKSAQIRVQQVLRHTYGHFWHSKVRILLMTGSVSDVEQLAPKLTRELWQEDRGTVLLWGGDPATPADADWLAALRKLRRRAVDGMVWVTSGLDGQRNLRSHARCNGWRVSCCKASL